MTVAGALAIACVAATAAAPDSLQAQDRVPHNQDRPPGPALSPSEAIAKMEVPDGFAVELVAAEPDIVNPVAMTFDERGRVWITESFEYPRREAGRGRDRIKVLEDTNGDGRADKVTVFAEGLNIPSGIAVGHGGVWVGNAPDLLFLQDTNGDGKADRQEVVVTGFGRHDTHELPNSFTWGPDGWLYGLNGVFNHSHVKYTLENPNYDPEHPGWQFTCAMFRIHPRTREFQVFAEGTSNPWGIAFDTEGSAFVSACVIDHLWHIVETGYYHRQGGPYPPFTWKIESIVDHKHQKAAYCGLEFFDSDAYPEEYRGRLYMGNIHGGCINVDRLHRAGSTYRATGDPDFLTANDAWFMPVDQKTGPDGCLYVLDWYDRYHCYQDANRDPEGIDRLKGRLYRVRYKDTPRAPQFDLAKETDEQLIERLGSPNVYFRETAQRILSERNTPKLVERLVAQVFSGNAPETRRRYALFALMGCDLLERNQHWELPKRLARSSDPQWRAWALRCLDVHAMRVLRAPEGSEALETAAAALVLGGLEDPSPDVRLQAVILVGQLARNGRTYVSYAGPLAECLIRSSDDPLLPRIVWRNLLPYLERQPHEALAFASAKGLAASSGGRELIPRVVEWLLAREPSDARIAAGVAASLLRGKDGHEATAARCLEIMAARVQNGELAGERLQMLQAELAPALRPLVENARTSEARGPAAEQALLLAASWKDASAFDAATSLLTAGRSEDTRLRALSALIAAGEDDRLLKAVRQTLRDKSGSSAPFRGRIISALGRLTAPAVAEVLLEDYGRLEPELQPRVVELLTQRATWAKRLLSAVGEKQVPADALNANQVRRLLDQNDAELSDAVRRHWGTVRTERNPAREKIVAEMRDFLLQNEGDPRKGREVYNKVCAQCHKLFGEGQEVGPDITVNGRGSFEQLLSNTFDPNLVIGAAYQAQTVATTEGRVLNGLLVEDSEQRIVLKTQGGKLEIIPRDEVEVSRQSELSLMPEDLEKQLKPQELADLFSYLMLTAPPDDPRARRLPLKDDARP
ncbi:MAG TPA: PVC-type heme-binding CxxCH protein [Planctomycetaceae bacterium]|nr:PVC-type heme-binding CxxCH protein [Planctomycetaceae bacterium]